MKQYRLLIDLFQKLSQRQEFEAGNARLSLHVMVGVFAVLSGLINLIAAFGPRPPIASYIFGNFVFTAILLAMVLTTEAVNTFLNPVEASILAHQPISDASYFTAKLTYLAGVVAYVVFPLNVVPALAGLNLPGASRWHPVTYLISAYLLGLFIALMICGALGLLSRVVHPGRLRNTALWVQVLFFVAIGIRPRLAAVVHITNGPALPLNWFVAMAAPSPSPARSFLTWSAALSMLCCAALIVFGIRALTKNYLMRVHAVLRGGPSRRGTRSGLMGPALRWLTGRPSGRAAAAFILAMAKTDWQFRRAAYPGMIQLLIFFVIAFARAGFGHSPFVPGRPTLSQALPHVGAIAGLVFCFLVKYSNQHRAAWIFLTFPPDSVRSFARGIYWALWLPVTATPMMLLPVLIWRWGIADAALFTAYCISVGSFYLSIELFTIDGLPFANPPESMKGSMTAPLVIAGVIGTLILVGLQWLFIFQSRFVTAGAVLIFAGSAFLIATRSMRYVEAAVLHNLHVIGAGNNVMFRSGEL